MRPNVLRSTVNSHWPLASNFCHCCCSFFGFVLLFESFLFPQGADFSKPKKIFNWGYCFTVSSVALAEYQLESLNSALPQKYDVAQGRKCEPAESGSLFNLIRLTWILKVKFSKQFFPSDLVMILYTQLQLLISLPCLLRVCHTEHLSSNTENGNW